MYEVIANINKVAIENVRSTITYKPAVREPVLSKF